MVMIDWSFLNDIISELNFFFTNLARSEQMKDIDMTSQTSKKADETNEDVSSTVVTFACSDGKVTMSLNTNENNKLYVWKENFYKMARTLLPDKLRELISFCKEDIIEQIKPALISALAGGMA